MNQDESDLLGYCVPVVDINDTVMEEANQIQKSKSTSSGKPPKHPDSDKSSTGSDCSEASDGKRRKVSIWWSHFDHSLNATHAKCKYCSTLIGCSSKNGTTCLKNHVQRCKKFPANLDKSQKMIELDAEIIEGDNGVLERVAVPSLWKYSQETCREALALMIILDELPFAFVEHEGFRYFCKCLNPAFVIPSRSTITRDVYSLFVGEKKRLKDCFKTLSSRVSLTTDAWTSSQNLSYMCLTAHFIDDNWVLYKRILNFCPLLGHSGHLIGRGVEKCLVDWGIKSIMTITVDNASSNDLAISYLRKKINHWESGILDGRYLHMRCVAHILNLVVKDGLKDMDKSILKVRTLVRFVRSSPARLQKFKACVEEEKLDSKSLVSLDVETRWNSTYLMLESALKFKKAFDNLLMMDAACKKEMLKLGGIKDEDWKKLNCFLPILKVFYDATLLLSGSRYVTCNTCVHHVFAIGLGISGLCMNEDEGVRKMANQMKLKYDKYWGDVHNMNYLLFVSLILDPRRKMQLVDWLIRQSFHATKAAVVNVNLMLLIGELFEKYASLVPKVKKSVVCSSSKNLIASSSGAVMDFTKLMTARFQNEVGSDDASEKKTELDKYLEEALEGDVEEFNILNWWRDNQKRYPILSKMARDVLAIPVTSVASESAFSTGGRVLDSFRTSLTPKMVEVLICTQDWKRKTNARVMIEESLFALEQIEEGMKELSILQPDFIIDESSMGDERSIAEDEELGF